MPLCFEDPWKAGVAMSRITIVRSAEPLPLEPILGHVRRFLFGLFVGLTEKDQSAWHKLWKLMVTLQPGEFMTVVFVFFRSTPYHRRHMKIEADVFKAQERFNNFDMFRDWLKIGASWVVWVPGAKGGVVPLPRSTSYAESDQAEFEQFHKQVIEFLRGPHASKYLWRHLGGAAHDMMDSILQEFGE